MRVSIKGMSYGIWKTVKEGHFAPKHEFNGVLVNKDNEDDWNKDDK